MKMSTEDIRNAVDKAMEKTDMSVRPLKKSDDGPADKQVLIRTTDEQRDYWKRAADESKVTLSSWIRETLDSAARSVLECDHPMAMTRFYPWATICTKCGKRLRG